MNTAIVKLIPSDTVRVDANATINIGDVVEVVGSERDNDGKEWFEVQYDGNDRNYIAHFEKDSLSFIN